MWTHSEKFDGVNTMIGTWGDEENSLQADGVRCRDLKDVDELNIEDLLLECMHC